MASTILTDFSGASVTAPGALAAIASISAALLPSGLYRVQCYAGYSAGTPGANEQVTGGNIALYVAGIPHLIGIPAMLGYFGPFEILVNLDGATAISLGTVLAGTAGVTYQCLLMAEQRVGDEVTFNV